MALKKSYIVITAFIAFWIIVIGWGMFKTTVKLTSKAKETPPSAPVKKEGENKEAGALGLLNKGKKNNETVSEEKIGAEKPAKQTPAAAETTPAMVKTVRVKAANFQDILPAMGTVKGKTTAELRFETNGVINAINFREGDKVKKGDTIASLDPKDALLRVEYTKKKLATAESAYKMDQKKVEITEKLYKVGAIIKEKLEEAQLETEKAKLEMEMTKQELEIALREVNKTYILAPKDGIIGSKDAEAGEFVTSNKKIASVMDINDINVEIGIIEKDIEKIKLGQKVEINVDAYPNQKFLGVIDNIFPVIEGKSRTLTAKVKVANPEGVLLPGMFSRANILIVQLKDAVMIPVTVLIKLTPTVNVVPVVSFGNAAPEEVEKGAVPGKVELRQVEVGYTGSDYVQIISGVNPGDLVITGSTGEIKDGTKVKVVGVEESAL